MSSHAAALCLKCRGARNLCGKPFCPLLSYWKALREIELPEATELHGPSPPTVFVGRHGYPKVSFSLGVLVTGGEASLLENQEKWLGKPLSEILRMRLAVVRGETKVDIRHADIPEEWRLASISKDPVDIEMALARKPSLRVLLDVFSPPLGPAGPVQKIRVSGELKLTRPVEKMYYSLDVKASDAVMYLYESGIPVSHIQRMLSTGALGYAFQRKLVPTRWSITAVDSTISQRLIEKIKDFEPFTEFLFFQWKHEDNNFIGIIVPRGWSYEWIEAWFPHTMWNPSSRIEVEGDYEGYKGRTTYASLGGCYYAARLAAAEYMLREKRQGTAILIREIYEGFFSPIGVWFVRENIRQLFRTKPEKYSSLGEVLERLGKATRLPLQVWLEKSRLLRNLLRQESILNYFSMHARGG
jgi:hypothetical protein